VKPTAFDYHAPATATEVVDLLAGLGDDAKVIAGGQSLVPMLALRLTAIEALVDLRRCEELRGIKDHPDGTWIGALTTERAIETSPRVAADVPLLARASPFVGHVQIRNRGTVGGSIAHADPAAEYPAVALALGATMETLSPRGRRTIPADGFFTGFWSTVLEPDELLTGAVFPRRGRRGGFAVEELARRHGDFALAGAAVAIELDDEGRIARCGLGLFGVSTIVVRAAGAERAVTGARPADVEPVEVGRLALADVESVPADLHASGDYRREMGTVMVTRAWRRAVEEATSHA
jgi:carbon-monoxide dehydrogenase medium subunit